MNFTNVKLVDGNYGAWAGSGLKTVANWYTTSQATGEAYTVGRYGIGTTAATTTAAGGGGTATINEDFYIIWNTWPDVGTTGASYTPEKKTSDDLSLTKLGTVLGINTLYFAVGDDSMRASNPGLDCAIVRKSDRRAVRIEVSSLTKTHYTTAIGANATITEINPSDGPWSPEIGRLVNMGYIG